MTKALGQSEVPVSEVVAAGDTAGPEYRAASTRIAASLREAILAGHYAPGSWIRQADVAHRYGASRLPVREALRMLAADGLTEYHPHQGARVPLLTAHEVDLVYRMRERLDPLALTESIPLLSEEDISQIRSLQEQIEALEDLETFLALDRKFHLATYGGCTMEPLMVIVERLWNTTQPYRRMYVRSIPQDRRWVINAEHRLLLDAIERRDTVDAERVLGGHIRRTRIELGRDPDIFSGG